MHVRVHDVIEVIWPFDISNDENGLGIFNPYSFRDTPARLKLTNGNFFMMISLRSEIKLKWVYRRQDFVISEQR